MNTKSIPMLVVGLAVAIIVTATVLMPVLNDAAVPDVKTFSNSGNIKADLMENGDAGSITVSEGALQITINGVLQTYAPTSQTNVLYGENVLLNHNANADVFSVGAFEEGTWNSYTGLTEISYSAANDKLTIIAGSDTIVVDLGMTFVWGDEGSYTAAFKQNGSTIYYSDKSPYLLNVGGYGAKNGVVFPSTYTLTDNHALVEGTQDVYTVKYSGADYVLNDGTTAKNTGVWMMISKEVSGLGPEKVSPGEKAIYFAIPIFVIISILLGAVSMINRSRD